MPQVELDKELCHNLKELRKSKKITAKSLSSEIGKSPTYISKLESFGIKKISLDDLIKYLLTVYGNKKEFEIHFDEFIAKCNINLTKEDIQKSDWRMNFDTVMRQISIPDSLVNEIIIHLDIYKLSIHKVIERTNKNEDLKPGEKKSLRSKGMNYWHTLKNGECKIYLDLSENTISDILTKKITTTNYVTLEAFLYNLYKFSNEDDFNNAHRLAIKLLSDNMFYTMYQKQEILKKTDSTEFLTDFDKTNSKLGNSIMNKFKTISELNIKYANEKMSVIETNMKTDLSLSIAYFATDLTELEHLSVDDKKQFLKEVNDLIKKFAEKKDAQQLTLFDDI